MAGGPKTNGKEASPTGEQGARSRRGSSTATLAKRLGLRLAASEELTIRRRRAGKGFTYLGPDGSRITDAEIVRRLASLAVPPA